MPFIPILEPEVAVKVTIPFASIKTDLRRVIDEWGFAVVEGVLSADECSTLEAAWNSDLQRVLCKPNSLGSRVAQNPARRWPLPKAPLTSISSGFASDFGLPQGRMAWGIRWHTNVKSVFEALFVAEELCVGLDVAFFSNNHPPQDHSRRDDSLWPHSDQSRWDPIAGAWEVFQSIVYVWPADDDTSSTVVWPKSHVEEYDILQNYRRSPNHFCRCDAAQTARFAVHARRVPVRAGGMIVWNSKLIHQGWSIGPRLAMPVCFEPVKRRDEGAIGRKRYAIQWGDATTHWASLAYPHNCSGVKEVEVEGLGTLTKSAHLWIQNDPEAQRKIEALL